MAHPSPNRMRSEGMEGQTLASFSRDRRGHPHIPEQNHRVLPLPLSQNSSDHNIGQRGKKRGKRKSETLDAGPGKRRPLDSPAFRRTGARVGGLGGREMGWVGWPGKSFAEVVWRAQGLTRRRCPRHASRRAGKVPIVGPAAKPKPAPVDRPARSNDMGAMPVGHDAEHEHKDTGMSWRPAYSSVELLARHPEPGVPPGQVRLAGSLTRTISPASSRIVVLAEEVACGTKV